MAIFGAILDFLVFRLLNGDFAVFSEFLDTYDLSVDILITILGRIIGMLQPFYGIG